MTRNIGGNGNKKELTELEGLLEQHPEYRKMQPVAGSLEANRQRSVP